MYANLSLSCWVLLRFIHRVFPYFAHHSILSPVRLEFGGGDGEPIAASDILSGQCKHIKAMSSHCHACHLFLRVSSSLARSCEFDVRKMDLAGSFVSVPRHR
ncbi:hypothetical protein EDD37DRAFT_643689 [Exophiala viscosa]|uniref:uncharacterized protein n=1 Tax=Exophiala viscosa TaxID=2486360 RepID=UPI002198016F|nr:hypothetical protein EDD37DRAFT_643689 [Exophiala viscosa]